MDLATATLLGVVVGAVIAWVVSLFQRQADKQARALERKYDRLHAASRLLRLSVIQAAELNYSRTFRARYFDVTAWPAQRWASFARTLADAGAALALVAEDIAGSVADEYEAAAQDLLEAWPSDNVKLKRYTVATWELRKLVESKARGLR